MTLGRLLVTVGWAGCCRIPRREATWVPPFYTATTLPTHGEDGNVLIWVTSIATEEVMEANEDELILADLDAQ